MDVVDMKGYETLIDRAIEPGTLEAKLLPAKKIVFDERSLRRYME